MLTQTQIDVLKKHPGLGWISALMRSARDPPVVGRRPPDPNTDLEAERLAEITPPEFPGERLIACYNPQLAEQRRSSCQELLAATEAELGALSAEWRGPAGRGPDDRRDRREGRQGYQPIQDGKTFQPDDSAMVTWRGLVQGGCDPTSRNSWMASMWSAPASRSGGRRLRTGAVIQAAGPGRAGIPVPQGDRPVEVPHSSPRP